MTISAADIAPKAFEQLVKQGGELQDVEDDLQVSEVAFLVLPATFCLAMFTVNGSEDVHALSANPVWRETTSLPNHTCDATTMAVCMATTSSVKGVKGMWHLGIASSCRMRVCPGSRGGIGTVCRHTWWGAAYHALETGCLCLPTLPWCRRQLSYHIISFFTNRT